jgi:hypothetical protein
MDEMEYLQQQQRRISELLAGMQAVSAGPSGSVELAQTK